MRGGGPIRAAILAAMALGAASSACGRTGLRVDEASRLDVDGARPDGPACTTDEECAPSGATFCSVARCAGGRCETTPRDCADDSECTIDSCSDAMSRCVRRPRDLDRDGYGDATCGGDDCDDSDPDINPEAVELCADRRDNDCNGRTDCSDAVCRAAPECLGCDPEVCTNGVDDDCDMIADCADSDCATDPACCVPAMEQCTNGRDDDCDMLVDCVDPSCAGARECCVPAAETCSNRVDDDCDDLLDCADPDCAGDRACCAASSETCNGRDDDCDDVADDGLSCFEVNGNVIQSIATGECGIDFYQYDAPDMASANPVPDIRVSGKVIVAIHAGPATCPDASIAVIADLPSDGSGGELRLAWTSTPTAVAGVLQSDDPPECSYEPSTGMGACDWRWQPCCTDGVLIGNYPADFCATLRLTGPIGVDEVRVLDGSSGRYLTFVFGSDVRVCRVTRPPA